MKRIVLIAALGLTLGGCASLQSTLSVVERSSVTPQQIVVAANSFDGLEATATTYLTGCAQKKYVCQQATVNSIVAAVRSGRSARNTLEAFLAANPGSSAPVSNYNILVTAISSIQGYSAQMAQ